MTLKKLKIAVISDLHCHPERTKSQENNTILFSDKLRSPENEHPVQSLLEIISSETLNVQLVLCPGDFTDHSDKQGFFSGWSYVNEISRALNADSIIATIGNHDIDSRHKHSSYSFDIPKKIKQNFPLKKEYLASFWESGYTFIEEENFQILVINSTHFHTHYKKDNEEGIDNPAVKGKIDEAQIEEIKKYLKHNNNKQKIKIALSHHHPISHTRLHLGEHDKIENGEELLKVLGEFEYDLFIHGHKHDPWLRYYDTFGYQLPILSSGSFSATNQILYCSKYNYFHIIDIEKVDSRAKGTIRTWTFRNKIGWEKDRDDGFYPYTGFGFLDDTQTLLEKIKKLLSSKSFLKWEYVLSQIPDLENLTPDKMDKLEKELAINGITISRKIGLRPKDIYYDQD